MQAGFKTDRNKHIYENIDKIIKFTDYDNVFAIKFVNDKKENSNFVNVLNNKTMMTKDETNLLLPNIKYIETRKSGYGLTKKTLSDIKTIYKNCENKEIHIVGTDYDSCVLAIGFQLFDIGLVPRFYYDLIATHSNNSLDLSIFQSVYKKNFGKNCFIFK